jgi:hypothetical protein
MREEREKKQHRWLTFLYPYFYYREVDVNKVETAEDKFWQFQLPQSD